MPRVSATGVSISLDGYVAGPDQSVDAPLGVHPPGFVLTHHPRPPLLMDGGGGGTPPDPPTGCRQPPRMPRPRDRGMSRFPSAPAERTLHDGTEPHTQPDVPDPR